MTPIPRPTPTPAPPSSGGNGPIQTTIGLALVAVGLFLKKIVAGFKRAIAWVKR